MKQNLLTACILFLTHILSGQVSLERVDTIPHQTPDFPEIILIHSLPEICKNSDGSINISCAGGTKPYTYSLDGVTYQVANTFSNIASGAYTAYVRDNAGYTTVSDAIVESKGDLRINRITTTSSVCSENTGTILLEPEGGHPPMLFTIDGRAQQTDGFFTRLHAGNYAVRIVDAAGCEVDTVVTVLQPGCSIYIPNIFSPNGDGINDYFQIRTSTKNNVMITRFFIFDNWGNIVYERYELPIHTDEGWWDGTHKRFTMNPGVFSYYLEAEFDNGQRETFKGNVTLMK